MNTVILTEKIENKMTEDNMTEDNMTEDKMIEDKMIEDKMIENKMVENQIDNKIRTKFSDYNIFTTEEWEKRFRWTKQNI